MMKLLSMKCTTTVLTIPQGSTTVEHILDVGGTVLRLAWLPMLIIHSMWWPSIASVRLMKLINLKHEGTLTFHIYLFVLKQLNLS